MATATPTTTRSTIVNGDARPLAKPAKAGSSEALGGRFWGLLRLSVGWVFLWAFLDKLLALGFASGRNPETGVVDRFGDSAWINGGSPTDGFLQHGLHTKAPFTDFYASLAGSAVIEWIYMLSMAAIGTALILGVATRLAAGAGIVWMAMFYTASAIWPENNPFLDEHIVYAIILAGSAYVGAGRYLGLGRRWERLSLVKRYPVLR
jgi:thiosulfate dehydrogenase [quinone] large subunit